MKSTRTWKADRRPLGLVLVVWVPVTAPLVLVRVPVRSEKVLVLAMLVLVMVLPARAETTLVSATVPVGQRRMGPPQRRRRHRL